MFVNEYKKINDIEMGGIIMSKVLVGIFNEQDLQQGRDKVEVKKSKGKTQFKLYRDEVSQKKGSTTVDSFYI